jgi:hypothetical protein
MFPSVLHQTTWMTIDLTEAKDILEYFRSARIGTPRTLLQLSQRKIVPFFFPPSSTKFADDNGATIDES